MNNKRSGTKFEREFADYLFSKGFWVLNVQPNQAGQPADIIAVKNEKALLIDCKELKTKRFELSRVETNQEMSMKLWNECGNGDSFFAIKLLNGEIYMMPFSIIRLLKHDECKSFTVDWLKKSAQRVDQWVTRFM